MRVQVVSRQSELSYSTRRLLERMVSPLCGLSQGIGYLLRGRGEPRFVVAGCELAGVHKLLELEEPGSYHIGGGGILVEEAVIRALGETAGRYAQAIAEVAGLQEITFARYDEMMQRGAALLSHDDLELFRAAQYAEPQFPFEPFSPDAPVGWLLASSLVDDVARWLPAQGVLVGYPIRRWAGEPWLFPAVTTGSAAHTRPGAATLNALLELVQVDAAVGHWYSGASANKIALDARTTAVERIVSSHFVPGGAYPTFFWLPNADLPGLVVACVLRGRSGSVPAVGIGLGADLDLAPAMYKALLEAVGVLQLAKVALIDPPGNGSAPSGLSIARPALSPDRILDLDSNVAYYAMPQNSGYIDTRFSDSHSVPASELPPDCALSERDGVALLVEAFRDTGKRLYGLDLTTPDLSSLGFTATRLWSPDTLSLCLPSAPPERHRRFEAYGGAIDRHPHPYP